MTMIDRQRRGRAAYERALTIRSWFGDGPAWDDLPQNGRDAWCYVADAAFEEGLYERDLNLAIEGTAVPVPEGHIHNGYCILVGGCTG